MHRNTTPLTFQSREATRQLVAWIRSHWQKALAILLVFFVILKKDVAIDLKLSGAPLDAEWFSLPEWLPSFPERTAFPAEEAPMNTSLIHPSDAQFTALGEQSKPNGRRGAAELGIGDWSWLKEDSGSKRAEKRRRQLQYVDAYHAMARREMEEFGIPASITLAQGLLESDAGQSRLATQNNNHFGIKCFSKTCKKGHCRNFSDDHHKDFFRVYETPEESYGAHSHLLLGDRYSDLFQLDPTDYIGWAFGLKKAGYATDKHYAEKLIYLIEDLTLYRYDH